MDLDLYSLKAFHLEYGLHDVTLEVRDVDDSDEYLLSCTLPIIDKQVSGQAHDCFAALQTLRRKAEAQNWNICCKGARRNVRPSAMSRQMGDGVKAYVLEMGRQACMDSMVNIFEADAPESYSTVADQETFAEAWFKSLG